MGVDGEPESDPSVLGQAVEQLFGYLNELPALLAHEVTVHGCGQVIRGGAMPEVGVDHDTQALQLIEVAIDGREMDVRSLGLHLGGKLLDGLVTL
jgi:hypothetical protein